MRNLRLVVLAVLLLAVQACASATRATPVATIDELAGKWKGTVTIGPRVDFLWLTINKDRTLIAIWGDITARGTVTVSGGQASYQMGPPLQEGSLTLYVDAGGKRQINMESMNGVFYATVTPES
ncbi:MAG: hypothetical protein ACRELZ_11310 [Candidatus Rokuibacteriota bacterium]